MEMRNIAQYFASLAESLQNADRSAAL